MLILMHDSERYGYLSMNGSAIQPGFVARKCGCDNLAQYETLLAELDSVGVPRRTSDGVIYNKRMVDDDLARRSERERKKKERLSGPCPGSVRRTNAGKEDEGEGENEAEVRRLKQTKASALEEIYGLYPRKVGRVAALKAIANVLAASGPEMVLRLKERVEAYALAVSKWSEQDRQFVPHPATWFNRGSFDDDPSTWIRTSAPGPAAKSHPSDPTAPARPLMR